MLPEITPNFLQVTEKEFVRRLLTCLIGFQESLLAVKRRKLVLFGYVTRHDTLPMTVLHRCMEGGCRRDKHKKWGLDNIKEGTVARPTEWSVEQVRLARLAAPHHVPTATDHRQQTAKKREGNHLMSTDMSVLV